MQILTQFFTPYPLNHLAFSTTLRLKTKNSWSRGGIISNTLCALSIFAVSFVFSCYALNFYIYPFEYLLFPASLFVNSRDILGNWAKKVERTKVSAVEKGNVDAATIKKRKIVEHICLVKAKHDLSEEQEKNMLDHLYTTQYQMRGIIAVSLGRVSDENPEQYTHAIFMRFQTKEDLDKFYENPLYIEVLKEHVMPYCHEFINLDYESEVEDDILPIFRKGEEFNYGVELMLLIDFLKSSLGGPAEDAIASMTNLAIEFPSLIVQATKGPNMNMSNKEYTHGVVIRFRSLDAFEIFMSSSAYKNMWKFNLEPIIQKCVCVHFSVDPIGTELM